LEVFQNVPIKIMRNLILKLTPLNPQFFNTRKKLKEHFESSLNLSKKKTLRVRQHQWYYPMVHAFLCCRSMNRGIHYGACNERYPSHFHIKERTMPKSASGSPKKVNPYRNLQECKGQLAYRNPFLQFMHKIKSCNCYAIERTVLRKLSVFLRNYFWNRMPNQTKEKVKLCLRTMGIASD